jgi:hypothetical protein
MQEKTTLFIEKEILKDFYKDFFLYFNLAMIAYMAVLWTVRGHFSCSRRMKYDNSHFHPDSMGMNCLDGERTFTYTVAYGLPLSQTDPGLLPEP